mgnify:FL=1
MLFEIAHNRKRKVEIMLDKIAMITLLIIMIIFFLAVVFTYLIILGADKSETAEEKEIEDQEQMEYLKKCRDERKGKHNGKKYN